MLPRPWKQDAAPACPDLPADQKTIAAPVLSLSYRLPLCPKTSNAAIYSNWRSEKPQFGAVQLNVGRSKNSTTTLRVTEAQFRTALASKPAPIVYIHGYNNSQEEATLRAWALYELAGRTRPVIALTWPSYAFVRSFAWDEANNEWARDLAIGQLEGILLPNQKAVIVAHSMGSRLLLDALVRSEYLRRAVGKLVFAAPDVDRQQFARAIGANATWAIPTTVYMSTRDQPLSASWRFHSMPRAGDRSRWVSGRWPGIPFVAGPNVSVVDLSLAKGDRKGHSNFIESSQGAADLCRVLSGKPHGARRQPITDAPHYYYARGRELDPGNECDLRAYAAIRIVNKEWKPERKPGREETENGGRGKD